MPRSTIPHTRRRGAMYWWRRIITLPALSISEKITITCEFSLRTREPNSARGRAAALTDFSERLRMSFQDNVARHGVSEEAIAAMFVDELRSYRNVLVHLECAWKAHPLWSSVSDRDTDLAVFEKLWAGIAEHGVGVPRDWEFVERHFAEFEPEMQVRIRDLLRRHPNLPEALREDAGLRLNAYQIPVNAISIPVAVDIIARAREEASRRVRTGEDFSDLAETASLARLGLNQGYFASVATAQPYAVAPANSLPKPEALTHEQSCYLEMTPSEFAEVFIRNKFSGLDHRKKDSKRQSRKVSESTLRDVRWAAQLLEKSLPPGTALSAVTANQLRDLDTWFDCLPVTIGKSPRDREPSTSLENIATRALERLETGELTGGDIGLTASTTNKHWHNIVRMHAELCRLVPSVKNIDVSEYITPDLKSAREARDQLSVEQGRAIFVLPPWTGCAAVDDRLSPGDLVIHDALYFVLLLVWYTGARREEICKLMVDDVFPIEETPFIYIRETVTGGVKTSNGQRKIPVHSELQRLGFLAYAQAMAMAGETLLFPELYPAGGTKRAIGDVFYKIWWLKVRGFVPDLKRGQAMHAARHSVSDALKQAGFSLEARNDILGQSQKWLGEGADRYSEPTALAAMSTMVESISNVTENLPSYSKIQLLPAALRVARPSRKLPQAES